MTILFTFFIFLFGIFGGLIGANYTEAQSKGRDTVSKNDINSIYQKLEESYNEEGEYPTEEEMLYNSESVLPGIDPEALIDNDGLPINAGTYSYEPYDCTATGCQKYTLRASLEDGTEYSKESLN